MPVDYSKGQIYTIRSHQTDAIYIGSTCAPLHKRLSGHKSNYKTWKEGKYDYITSFEIMKYDDAYVELLEDFPCDSKKKLDRREGQLIRSMACVNKNVAGRTVAEYREENKEQAAEMGRKWREGNKEHVVESWRAYSLANKDAILARSKAYREANKEKMYQRQGQKVTCECGAIVCRSYISTHRKREKHELLLAEKSHTNSYSEHGVDQASEDTDP